MIFLGSGIYLGKIFVVYLGVEGWNLGVKIVYLLGFFLWIFVVGLFVVIKIGRFWIKF